MNLVAKIFVVFITLVAFGLMLLSVMVYSTHTNWKAEAEAVNKELSDEKVKNQELNSEKQRLENQLTANLEASLQEVRKLESELTIQRDESKADQEELKALRLVHRTNDEAIEATQANNEKLTAEVEVLRGEIRSHQQSRDEAFTTMLEATDALHQSKNELSAVRERNLQLVQDLGRSATVLRDNGIDPNTDPTAVVPHVRGVVSATHRSAGKQLIEVTVGADDGLKPGQTIEVFRGDRYLGRAEILKTEPDRAVGRILRRFQQGQIQEGDHVATKLRIG